MISVKIYSSSDAIKKDWEAVEEDVSHYPFQCFWYIEFFAKKFYQHDQLFFLGIFDDDTPLAFGAFAGNGDRVEFIGTKRITPEANIGLTDYADLLYSDEGKNRAVDIWQSLRKFFKEKKLKLFLEFVREDSPTVSSFSLLEKEQREVAPHLILPDSFDVYIQSLPRKERHELRRKLRRIDDESVVCSVVDGYEEKAFQDFIQLHRLSQPEKNAFMTKEMGQIFKDIAQLQTKHWTIQFISLHLNDSVTASAMYYMNDSHSLLYNSGYDPNFSHWSVGLILQAKMIEKSIQEHKKVYDFLRGNESYKYRLGGRDMLLYRIQIA